MNAPFLPRSIPVAELSRFGLVGYWCMDQLETSPRPVIRNLASGQPVSQNLHSGPRRLFANSLFYQNYTGGGATYTITDDAAADSDGVSGEATTYNVTASAFLQLQGGGESYPAGTYTIAVSAKRNTGADQLFRFTPDFTGTVSADKTATASWQRFSATFTLGAPGAISSWGILWGSVNTGQNIQFADLEVFAGSSDLGGLANKLGGHCYPNIRSVTALSASGGFVDMSGKFGTIQFPAGTSVTQWTVMALVKKTANTNTKDTSLSKLQAFAEFGAPYSFDGQPILTSKASGAQQFANYVGIWQPNGQGVHVVTHRVTATEESIWIDGVKMARATATAAAFTLRDLWFARYDTALGDSLYNQVALWNRALTDDEIVRNTQAMWNRAKPANISPAKQRLYIPTGDSQTNANGNTFPYQLTSGLTYAQLGYNRGVSGYTVNDLVAQLSTYKEICDNARRFGRQVVVSILIGANDLSLEAGATDSIAANAWTARLLSTLIQPLRGYGAKVILCTSLPVGTPAGATYSAKHNARRAVANPTILGWVASGNVDATADFAGDATYGPDAAAEDGAKYPDGLHPVAAAHSGPFKTLMVAALNSIPLVG